MTGKPTPGPWKRYKDSIHPSFDGPSPHTTNGDRVICDLFGPDKAFNAFLILAANEAHEACERVGYDGLEAVKALPELMERVCSLLETIEEYELAGEIDSGADGEGDYEATRALLDRLTKKGGKDAG